MGQCNVIANLGDGYYTVEIIKDKGNIGALTESTEKAISEAETRVNDLSADLFFTQNQINTVAQTINAAIDSASKPITAAERATIDTLTGELTELSFKAGALKEQIALTKILIQSKNKLLESFSGVTTPDIRNIWCADLSPDLAAGVYGTLEVNRENKTILIQPGGLAQSTKLQPTTASGPMTTAYNVAVLAAVQRDRPTYRVAVLSNLDHISNTCAVVLNVAHSSQQSININKGLVYSGVKIDYMDCDSDAFENEDIVIVQFRAGEPVVIGFAESPKPCATPYFLWTMGGFARVKYNASGFVGETILSSSNEGFAAGRMNWIGVKSVLSWGSNNNRYILPDNTNDAVFYNGKVIAISGGVIAGACIHKNFIVIVLKTGAVKTYDKKGLFLTQSTVAGSAGWKITQVIAFNKIGTAGVTGSVRKDKFVEFRISCALLEGVVSVSVTQEIEHSYVFPVAESTVIDGSTLNARTASIQIQVAEQKILFAVDYTTEIMHAKMTVPQYKDLVGFINARENGGFTSILESSYEHDSSFEIDINGVTMFSSDTSRNATDRNRLLVSTITTDGKSFVLSLSVITNSISDKISIEGIDLRFGVMGILRHSASYAATYTRGSSNHPASVSSGYSISVEDKLTYIVNHNGNDIYNNIVHDTSYSKDLPTGAYSAGFPSLIFDASDEFSTPLSNQLYGLFRGVDGQLQNSAVSEAVFIPPEIKSNLTVCGNNYDKVIIQFKYKPKFSDEIKEVFNDEGRMQGADHRSIKVM